MHYPESSEFNNKFRWHENSSARAGSGKSHNYSDIIQIGSLASHPEGSETVLICDSNPILALAQVFAAVKNNTPFGLVPAGQHDCPLDLDAAISRLAGRFGDRNFLLCMSSGSRGSPNWICRTQGSWLRSFEVNAKLWGIDPDAEFAILGRLGFSIALYGSLEALHHGADLLLLGGFRPDTQLTALSNSRVTHIYATPTQLRLLADAHRRKNGKELSSVSHVLVGGAKLDDSTREISSRIFSEAEILEFYGAAETSFVAAANRISPKGSVGLPYPGAEIEIRDIRELAVPFGTCGEIWVRSPYLFLGYAHGDSEGTLMDERGFLTVGEIGNQDSQGNLYILGRTDRMVTVADQNVHPELIENFLLKFDGIERAAAIPVADSVRGHKIVAFVLRRVGNTSREHIIKSCRKKFGTLVSPDKIFDLKHWPVLPSGKTDYNVLARSAASKEL